MLVMFIAIVVLAFKLFKKGPEPINNTEAISILKEQILYLENQNAALKNQHNMQRSLDSTLIKKYEAKIREDAFTIQQLKKNRDEKINVIDTAGDAELRRILAEG